MKLMDGQTGWMRFRTIAQKIGRGLIFIFASAIFLAAGYAAVYFGAGYLESRRQVAYEPPPVEVYKNETHSLGLQYPKSWEVQEVNTNYVVFSPPVEEGQTKPKEFIALSVSSNAARGITPCENDSSNCTFRNPGGIVGDRTSTPEQEIIFFTGGENDFGLILYKYGENDFLDIFEAMGKSMRFVTEIEQNETESN